MLESRAELGLWTGLGLGVFRIKVLFILSIQWVSGR